MMEQMMYRMPRLKFLNRFYKENQGGKYEKYNHFGGDYRDYGKSYLLKLVPNLVEKIGLDKLKQYIKEFNTLYIDNKLDNILDTKMAFHR